jgi:hypothetical protein
MATATPQSTWDARIARARELASSRPAARDLLTFYAALAEYQRALAANAGDRETFDVDDVVEAIPGFLAWLRQNGPVDLAESVEQLDRTELDSLVASAFRRKAAAAGRTSLTKSSRLKAEATGGRRLRLRP